MDLVTTTIAPVVAAADSALLWIVVAGFVVAFFLAFGVGANDVANSFGTSVGAKVLTLRQACILATIFEVLGAVLIGYKVSDTVRKGIFDVNIYAGDEKTLMLGNLAALLGSAVWNIVATFLALPISGTHSIVGAVVGFSLVAKGTNGIRWKGLMKIIGSWFISPVLSGVLSAFIFFIIVKGILKTNNPLRNGLISLPFFYFFALFINLFSVFHDGPAVLHFNQIPLWGAFAISGLLALATALGVWFFLVPKLRSEIEGEKAPVKGMFNKDSDTTTINQCHVNIGFVPAESTEKIAPIEASTQDICESEDPQIGRLFSFLQILTAVFGSFAHGGNDVSNAIGPLVALWLIFTEKTVTQSAETPLWILLYGGFGICVGLWLYGQKVIRTVGENLTKISPVNGFSIEIGSATTVLLASKIGIPISTTHCKVGSIVFVGLFKSQEGVNWGLFRGIAAAWLLTLPITGGLSGLIMYILMKTVT